MRSITALAGGNVQYQSTTINGGYLFGPGMHTLPSGVRQHTKQHYHQSRHGRCSKLARHVHQCDESRQNDQQRLLDLSGGINDGSGSLTVAGTANTSNWLSAGMIVIAAGGLLNNHANDLTSYGGGRITVNSGGTLDADSQNEGVALDLQDSLLVNNGAVTDTTNVNYGATVSGSGSFGPINVNYGGCWPSLPAPVP